jgi:hypothetical protein
MKIIIYLLFLVILLASLSFKEGFESGQYAYLAPIKPYVLDDATKTNFITAYNGSGGAVFPNATIKDGNVDGFKSYSNLDEINYYIQNKKWPINSYIKNYLDANKADISEKLTKLKINSVDDLYRIGPARMIYGLFIHPQEYKLSPVPLSNDIFMGKKPPPVESVPETTTETPSEPTVRPPFSSENYSKLQSICSTLK